MASNVIEFIIKLKDQASSQLAAFKNKFGTALAFGAGIAGVTGFATAIAKVVHNTAEAEDAMVKFDLAFKNLGRTSGKTAEELKRFADEAGKSTIFDDESILKAETALLRFGSVSGKTFDRAREAAINLASAMGTDLESAATLVGRAIERPELAIRQLRSAGVTFTADQEKLIKSLIDTGDRAGAAGIVMEKLESQFKGAADAAANTLGGAIKRTQNALNNLFELDGSGMKDAFNDLADTLNDPAVKAGIQSLLVGLTQIVSLAIKAAGKIGEIVGGITVLAGGGSNKIVNAGDEVRRLEAERDRQLSMAGRAGVNADAAREAIRARYKIQIDEALKYEQAVIDSEGRAAAETAKITKTTTDTVKAAYGELDEVVVHVWEQGQGAMADYYDRLNEMTQTSLEKQISDYHTMSNALETLWADGQISAEQYFERLKAITEDGLDEVVVTVHSVIIPAIQTPFDKLIDSVSDALERMLNNGKGSFRELGAYLLREVASGLIKKALDLLAASIKKAFASGGGGAATGGFVTGLLHAFGFAGGGQSAKPFIAGENGPELVIPNGTSRVYNAQQLAGMGGGGISYKGGDINIVVQGNADEKTMAEVAYMIERRVARSDRENLRTWQRQGIVRPV